MNSKKLLFGPFSLLILILAIGVVNAQEDFTAKSSKIVDLCPCSNQAYTITVQNTGTVPNSYSVIASGDAAEWITFNPSKFVLNAGQKGSFSAVVDSVCNIKGDFALEVFITTNNGLTKVVRQTLRFSACYDYSLEQGDVVEDVEESVKFLEHDSSYALCKDEQKSIPILITNNEGFGNRYKIFLDSPEWVGLNTNSVTLGSKKSGILLLNFDTTNVEGEFDIKLSTISELGKVQRKNNIEVNVQDCYALELDVVKEVDIVCGGEKKEYDIVVKNPVDFEKNVELELDGLEWASFGNISSFDLGSEEEKITTLTVNPSAEVSGSFLLRVSALVGNKTKLDDQIRIDVTSKQACYEANINTKASITNFYSEDFFSVTVKNNGIKKSIYSVSLEGESWVDINPTTLELNPGQTGNLNLNVGPSEDVEPGSYVVKINLESEGAFYSKDVDLTLRKENESVKKVKEFVKAYKYYIYLSALIVVLFFIFRKPLIRIKNKVKKDYEKHKVKEARLRALKLARREKEEEKEKAEEEKKKKETRKKEVKKKKSSKKTPFSKALVYLVVIIAAVLFVGHQNKLFNVKYLHLYVKNIFVGYFYYILIGVGVIVGLLFLLLLYNFVFRKKKNKKVKKEVKKAEKKGKEWYSKLFHVIAVFVPIFIIITALSYLNLFAEIKDFVLLYANYFGLGVLILIGIILLIRFYKPLFKFLRE